MIGLAISNIIIYGQTHFPFTVICFFSVDYDSYYNNDGDDDDDDDVVVENVNEIIHFFFFLPKKMYMITHSITVI